MIEVLSVSSTVHVVPVVLAVLMTKRAKTTNCQRELTKGIALPVVTIAHAVVTKPVLRVRNRIQRCVSSDA